MKKWRVCLLLGIFALTHTSCFKRTESGSISDTVAAIDDPSVQTIPVAYFSDGEVPCVLVRIENKTVPALLDLGFRGFVSIPFDLLENVDEKIFLGTRTMYGVRGKKSEKRKFQIPYISIGPVAFRDLICLEEMGKREDSGVFLKEGETTYGFESAKIGWEIFQEHDLFLDLNHSKIALCDQLRALDRLGYPIDSFSKTSLILEKGLIEFDIQTSAGKKRCVLDTGSTWNIINENLNKEKTLDELVREPNNFLEVSSVLIGGQEFGPQQFRVLPIQVPIHIEAILGMEFLKNHLVFIDFKNNQIYFSKQEETLPR